MTEKIRQSQKNETNPRSNGHEHHKIFTLVLQEKDSGPESDVFLIPGFDSKDKRISSATARSSLLYPIHPQEFQGVGAKKYSLAFLAPRRSLEFISELSEQQRNSALFGCGSCSVVLATSDRSLLQGVIHEYQDNLYAWEIWDIADARLIKAENSWQLHPVRELKRVELQFDQGLSESTVWLLHELSVNLNHYYEYAQLYAPFVEAEIEALATEVNELAEEIRQDEELQILSVKASQEGSSSSHDQHTQFLGAKKRLNTDVDLLVQLNSALVYAITQAFAGAIPIRRRYPNISQQSLLGTGTAWRAVQRTCSIVFNAFRRSRFPDTIRQDLDPSREDYDASQPESEESHLNTRVVHFSARNGFGESSAAITCPSQVIQVCDQPEWSLCTATHEILHAHVRELISAVFLETLDGDTPRAFDECLAESVEDYRKQLPAQRSGQARPTSQLQELRFGLIDYAVTYRATLAKAKEKFAIDSSDLDAEDSVDVLVTLPNDIGVMFRAFKRSFRLLEETVVHTLDLHYFFAGDSVLFCDSLWNTWSIIPSIIEKLDWYILRTLLALASTTSGSNYDRLDKVLGILTDSLNKIMRRQQGSVVAEEVLRRLSTTSNADGEQVRTPFLLWIDLLFPACLPLVDLTTKFLISKTLKREFKELGGDLLDAEGHYPIDLPDFDTKGIANPLALIHDRLKIGLDSEGMRAVNSVYTARASAWLLLALSSEKRPAQTNTSI